MNENQLSHWNGRTGAYLGTVTVDNDGSPAFSQDNKRLVFGSTDGTVLTWDLDPAWIAAACRLAGRSLSEQEWHDYLPNSPLVRVCA
jgi:WD40 repeat protein